jgi:hypothetical protein
MAKDENQYSNPALRERLKNKIMKGTKGGRAGQWSARKAQLLAHEYKEQGGGYKSGKRSEGAKHLNAWTKEKWQTSDGKKADRKVGGKRTMTRYLPKKAWDELSPAEKKSTNDKKRKGSKEGRQFVANTKSAAGARQQAAIAVSKKKAAGARKKATKSPAKKKTKTVKRTAKKKK